eukprot:4594195-Pyramimonas_sp.AAC.1
MADMPPSFLRPLWDAGFVSFAAPAKPGLKRWATRSPSGPGAVDLGGARPRCLFVGTRNLPAKRAH